MSDSIGKASIAIGADSTDFAKEAETGVMAGMKKVASTLAAAFAATKVFDFFKDSALLAEAAATANIKLETTLLNAGDAAGEWSARQIELAESLSMSTGVHDEVIKGGQAILATFHNVASTAGEAGGAFDRATIAAVDLSAAGFGSVESASTMLGKALQDPAKGLTALTRVGVTFTDAQKEQVEAMVAAGDAAAAQNIILEAVEGQVGGVAEATADASAIMGVAWQNVKETIGALLLPVLEALANFVSNTLLPVIQTLVGWIEAYVVPALRSMSEWVSDNSETLKTVAAVITAVFLPALAKMGISALINAAKVVASWAVQAASAAASLAAQAVTFAVMGGYYAWLGIQAALGAAKVAAGWIAQQLASKGSLAAQLGAFAALAAQWIAAGVRAVVTAAIQVGAWIAMAAAAMVNAVIMAAAWLIAMGPVGLVIAAVVAVIAIFALLWNKLEGFREFWINLWETVKTVFINIWDAIVGFFEAAVEAIRAGIQAFVDRVLAIWDGIWGLVTAAKDMLANLWNAFWDGIKRIIDSLVGWIADILRPFKDAAVQMIQVGKDFVRGLWEGIKSMGQWLWDKVTGFIIDFLPGPVKWALGIESPSKVMAEYGKYAVEGMAKGIDDNAALVSRAAESMAMGVPEGASRVEAPAAPAAVGATTINVTVSMDDLAQLGTLEEFLRMIQNRRVDERRGERVVV